MRQKRETTSARVARTPTRRSTSMPRVLTSAASATSCCKAQPSCAYSAAQWTARGGGARRSTSASGVEETSTHSTAIDAHGARLQRRTECSGGRGGQERAHVRRAMRARRCAPRAAPAPTGGAVPERSTAQRRRSAPTESPTDWPGLQGARRRGRPATALACAKTRPTRTPRHPRTRAAAPRAQAAAPKGQNRRRANRKPQPPKNPLS
jgi:hypothetical protein